jgi:preprotein translocase subunit SecA
MDDAQRARYQIRVVRAVFRVERDRVERRVTDPEILEDLQRRSLALLDELQDRLTGAEPADAELLAELANARGELRPMG